MASFLTAINVDSETLVYGWSERVTSDVNKRIVLLNVKPVNDQMCSNFHKVMFYEYLSIHIIKHKRLCSFKPMLISVVFLPFFSQTNV